jgi:hypothetical protein
VKSINVVEPENALDAVRAIKVGRMWVYLRLEWGTGRSRARKRRTRRRLELQRRRRGRVLR